MVNKEESAFVLKRLYVALNSNALWDLAAEQWLWEGRAIPAFYLRSGDHSTKLAQASSAGEAGNYQYCWRSNDGTCWKCSKAADCT